MVDFLARNHLFRLLPFDADSFFDTQPVKPPKAWRTGSPSVICAWRMTGPGKKAPHTLRFSIAGLGRAWGDTGGGGNSQGSRGLGAGFLGGRTSYTADIPGENSGDSLTCTITFSNNTGGVSTSFEVSGTLNSKYVKPPDGNTKARKSSTIKLRLKGPPKPPTA